MAANHRHVSAIGRSAMGKAFWRILPLILIAYLFAYMDRVNVSFAATQMNEDLRFSATIYGLGGGLFFLGYALFEIPSNLMLVRFGARRWIARIMITWGLLSAAMMFVATPMQFYALRFLLGVAEAGFYPGVIFYFSGWFPPCHRSRAVSRFFIASPLASVAMGGMSGWLLALDETGGLHGWQWLFLVQGLPTVVFGLVVLRYLPDAPATSAWLTADEKAWIETELAREQARIGAPARHDVLGAFRNPRVLLLGAIGFLLIAVITTVILNAPLILLEATALDTKSIGYLVALGGLLGAAAILVLGNHADRNGDRWGAAFRCGIVLAAAVLVMGLSPSPLLTCIAYLAFAAVCFAIPMLTSSGWAEALHVRELAVGAAAINTLSQIGAFLAPYGWGAAKDATGSFELALVVFSVVALLMSALILVLRHRLRGHSAPAMAQESSYRPGTVWNAGRIDVLPGQFENYMDWLATSWKKIQELGKAEGIVVDYHVLATNNARAGEPDLILIVEYKDYLTTAQQEAFNKKVNAMLSQTDRTAGAASAERGKMREQLGSIEYQELILK